MAGSSGKARLAVRALRELRRNDKSQARNHQLNRCIRNELRMQLDSFEECKASQQMQQLASTNTAYLTNQMFWHEVHKQYYSGGATQSVEETARIVRTKLPHDPNISHLETDNITDKI